MKQCIDKRKPKRYMTRSSCRGHSPHIRSLDLPGFELGRKELERADKRAAKMQANPIAYNKNEGRVSGTLDYQGVVTGRFKT